MVVAGALDCVGALAVEDGVVVELDEDAVLTASVRFFAVTFFFVATVFFTTALATVVFVAAAAAGLAVCDLPAATTATRTAVRAVAAAAVQRVSRLTRRRPAVRARRWRVCSRTVMEP